MGVDDAVEMLEDSDGKEDDNDIRNDDANVVDEDAGYVKVDLDVVGFDDVEGIFDDDDDDVVDVYDVDVADLLDDEVVEADDVDVFDVVVVVTLINVAVDDAVYDDAGLAVTVMDAFLVSNGEVDEDDVDHADDVVCRVLPVAVASDDVQGWVF